MPGAPATPADENKREEYDHGWWKSAAGNINGAQFVLQEKLARLTWRTPEWRSRAEEEDISIDVSYSSATKGERR